MSRFETLERMLRALRAVVLAGVLVFLWIELILWLLNLRGTGDELGGIIFVVLCVVLGALPLAALRNMKTQRRARLIEREADRWQTERRLGRPRMCTWQRRLLLAIPSAVALLFMLFEPETIGIWQHLLHPSAFRLGDYRISTPITWVIYSIPNREHAEELWMMNAEGIARMGRHPYWAIGPHVIWDLGFSTTTPLDPHPFHVHRFPEFLSTRKATIGGREVTCQEYQYLGRHFHTVIIACSSAEDNFHIHFDGWQVPPFYDFLQHSVWREGRYERPYL